MKCRGAKNLQAPLLAAPPQKNQRSIKSKRLLLDTGARGPYPSPVIGMRCIALALAIFCFSPSTLFAQRLLITPVAITIVEGESGGFTVVLSEAPTADVTVTIVGSGGTDVRLDKSVLTFTPSTWNVPQTVTMMAGEDADVADDADRLILIASGEDYGDEDGITVSPEIVQIESVDKTVQLSAVVQDQDGASVTGLPLAWSSADSLIAVVDSTGNVTGVGNGTTTITAAFSAASGEATIFVNDPSLIPSDRKILEVLYRATEGDEWARRDGWLTNAPLDQWYGVETDKDGRVTALGLRENGLKGIVSVELAGLQKLRTLYLDQNQLSGSIPSTFVQLEELKIFHWQENDRLCAPGTMDFEAWRNAENRDFQGPYCNRADRAALEQLYENTDGANWPHSTGWLDGAAVEEWYGVSADSLGRVTLLDLEDNGLQGQLPSSLRNLGELSILRVGDNPLSGQVPRSLAQLALKEFRYANTDLCIPQGGIFQQWLATISVHEGTDVRCPPPSDREVLEMLYIATGGDEWVRRDGWLTDVPLDQWHRVETNEKGDVVYLALVYNNLTGTLPPLLGELRSLEKLLLYGNNLTGPIPPELGNLTQLKELNIDSNSLSGPIPPELGNLTQLKELILNSNSLSGPIPPELGNIKQLRELELGSNSLSGPIPSELSNLSALTELILVRNKLSGPIPPELGNLSQLEYLWLFNNELSGSIPPELGNLKQLTHLSLGTNLLSGSIPPELGNLASLKELLIPRARLSGSIPPELGNLAQLETLWLFRNELSGPIPPELGNLKQLQKLSLSINLLSGSIPPEISNLSVLTELTLDRNKLSGPIPPELGNLSQLKYLWLFENELSGSIPPELGNLKQLTHLSLGTNLLSGPIPPELGNLVQLEELVLDENSLSGPIPPELGNFKNLTNLFLQKNPDLEGLLPRSFIGLGVGDLNITKTGVCRQQDVEFLEWWDNIPVSKSDHCEPEQIERLALMQLYDKTNGASWTNGAGWGNNGPLGDWHGVTVENGRIKELSLPNNALKNSVPGEVANFTELEVLNLANNSLVGDLPKEIPLLRELTELRVNGNADLGGILGYDLVQLTELEVLHFGGTLICASPAPTFQMWYTDIFDASGMVCGNPAEVLLNVEAAYLTQSVQTPGGTVRLVEGRDALLRVFVTGDSDPAFFEQKVVATIHGGGRLHQVEMTRATDRLATKVNESDLANSFNTVIPGDFITPGATLVVEADPEGVIPRTVGSRDRFPATGEASLNVIPVPDMELTVVPVLEAEQPDISIFAWTNNIGNDSPEVGLLKYAFPFHRFHARSRKVYITSLDLTTDAGQWSLVLELEVLRLLDNATGYYYGAAASVNGYVRGRARLAGWASIGKAWDTELAHEVGHSLGLLHAPCGGALGTDPDFPHSGGSVGTWGFDFRDSTLISPEYHKDIMGYCYERGWLSDYYFEQVIDYREKVEGRSERMVAGASQKSDMLVLWGGVQGGELRIEPPFSASVSAQLPEADGPYRLEGFAGDVSLFSLSFTPGQDKFGDKYFLFAIPVEQNWQESLDRIVLTGPEGNMAVGEDDQRTLSVFRDASTGEIRGILRDWNGDLPVALQQTDNLNIMTTQGLIDSVHQQR